MHVCVHDYIYGFMCFRVVWCIYAMCVHAYEQVCVNVCVWLYNYICKYACTRSNSAKLQNYQLISMQLNIRLDVQRTQSSVTTSSK